MCISSFSLTAVSTAAESASSAPSDAEITFYEAENAERTGDLWEGSFDLASGGKAITQISRNNYITFNVEVPEPGEYDVQVHYATYNNYSFKFVVNGDEQSAAEFSCPSNYSWGDNPFGMITTTVVLKEGMNTIKLTSDRADNTDTRFDRIGISKARPKHNNDVILRDEALPPEDPDTVWYRSPAGKWAESLPLGNGRMGAMIWGGIYEDTVSLNEVTCWSGEDHADKNVDNPNGPVYLKKIQEEFQKESPDRAAISEYFKQMGGNQNDGFGTSRPFGVLKFNFDYEGDDVSQYIRSLDLDESMSYVNYTVNGVNYERQAFISNPDQVMVMKYSADEAEKISFDVNYALEEPAGGNGTVSVDNDTLVFSGKPAAKSELNTYARLKAIPTGGIISYDKYGIHISGADEVVLVLAMGTTFNDNTPEPVCAEQIEKAVEKGYQSLKNDHINDVKPRFERMNIQLGAEGENIPTNERVERIRNGGEPDGDFIRLWYQYARYLMLAGSREDSPLPMHLQGIWNDNVSCNMIWNCDYHLDINIQMNQWMSNASNLSEGEKPIFKFMREHLIPSGKVTAEKQYGANGWTVGIVTNPWGYSGNTGEVGAWEGSTTSGAWLAQEIMNYFDHTWDTDFLANEGLPMLKETADFFLDYLVEYSRDINPADGRGYLVTIPGSSPENGDLEVMPAYDRTMIYDIFYQVLRSYDILGLDHDEYYGRVNEALGRLAPYKISKYGQLAEWPYNDMTDGASEHRTTSNLLGVFPYDQITPDKTPELARAALLSMDRKFELPSFEHTEWTCVNAQGMYARFKDGEKAFDYLKRLAVTFTWPNLMSISPEGIGGAETDVYIIDGVLGMAAGVNEMLLQSHSDRLEFLPAIPSAWDQGRINGMKARGAFETDFEWKNYKLSGARIRSTAGNKCRIYMNNAADWSTAEIYLDNGGSLTKADTAVEDNCISFDTEKDGEYVLKVTGSEAQEGYASYRNDDSPQIEYTGTWKWEKNRHEKGISSYCDDAHIADTEGAAAEFTFTGTGVEVIGGECDGGSARLLLDGKEAGSVQFKDSECVFSIESLANTKHTLELVYESGSIALDAFAVRNSGGAYFADGTYTLNSITDGKMLTSSGDEVKQYAKLGGSNQQWLIDPIDDTYCHIINAQSGLQLGTNASGNSIEEAAKWDGSQDWNIMDSFRTDGLSVIENKKSGNYLQVDSGWPYDGAGISPYPYSRQDHYEWKINDLQNGFYTIQRSLNDSVAEVVTDPGSVSRGRVLINSLSVSGSQKWKIENAGDDLFTITNTASGKVIKEEHGVPVMSDDRNSTSSKWTLSKGMQNAKEYYTLINASTGNALSDEKWIISQVSGSDASDTALPIAYSLKTDGAAAAGKDIRLSYKYINISDAAESGSVYSAYLLDNAYESIDGKAPFATGSIAAETGISVTVPDEFDESKVLLFEVTPKAGELVGTKAYLVVTAPEEKALKKADIIYSESFDAGTAAADVASGRNGWYSGADSGARIEFVDGQNGENGNCLGFMARDTWYKNAWAGLDLTATGNDALAELDGKTYIAFDVKFTMPDNLDPNSTASISLLGEGQDNRFATLRLRDFSADIIGLDDSMKENVKYNVATTLDDMYDKWFKVEMYVDAQNNSYAVKVNGRSVMPRYGQFLPASSSTILGTANPVSIGRLKGFELRQDWYSQNAGIWLDNLEIGSYTSESRLYTESLAPVNDKVICGADNTFALKVKGAESEDKINAYIGLYNEDGALCGVNEYEDIKFDGDTFEKEFTMKVPDKTGSYVMKVFLWNENMEPLSAAYSVNIQAAR